MIFSSLEYLLFLPIVVFLYWRTAGSARLALVVLASYFFYMSWLPTYGVLLLILTCANWLLGLAIGKFRTRRSNLTRSLLGAGLLLNLGCLCYYKYANFFLSNIAVVLNGMHRWLRPIPAWQAPIVSVLLPLGISFFVFEFVHYVVDVYRGHKPIRSFLEFAAFAAFFPSQIAGPIKRYQDFVEWLRKPLPWTDSLFTEGAALIMQGLFKKVAIADPLGAAIYAGFTATHLISSLDALIAAVGFVIQVYCDFSGYTDIGRGSAMLLGIRLPENFNLPYLSHDLADFWRRWHMSLSYWLRDYVYIPLGGSRMGILGNWRNLFVTMMACGLWHGAAWHYVIFGAMQGVGLIVNREWRSLLSRARMLESVCNTNAGKVFGTFVTMTFVTVSYTVFRAPDMGRALNVLSSLANFSSAGELWLLVVKSGVLPFLCVYAGYWLVTEFLKRHPDSFGSLFDPRRGFVYPVRCAAWTAAVLIMIAARPTQATPFVYFQF